MPSYPLPGAARRFVALCAVLCLLLAGCRSSDPVSMMAQAREAHAQGEVRSAVIVLKNLIRQDPAHRAARVLLAELHLEQGDPLSAEKELRRAIALGADDGKIALLLGQSLLMQGQYERLLSDTVPASDPARRPAMLALRGSALLGLKRIDEARAQFQDALQLQANAPEALLGLARIAVWEKNSGQAHRLLNRALAAHPSDIDCLRYKADLLRAEGSAAAALVLQQKILERHPHNIQALLDTANLHTDAGRFDLARSALAAARSRAGASIGVLYTQALLDFRERRLSAALESVQKILAAAPEHHPSLLLAGALQTELGAHQQATSHLQRFLQTYPGHPYATQLLAQINLATHNPTAALALLQPLLAQHGDDAGLLALAGEARLQLRQFNDASALFERASALQPNAASLHTGLAMSRLGSGDTPRAIAELERAAALEPNPARSGTLLVMGYLRANLTDKALAAALDMESKANDPLVQNLKGGIYLARNDIPSARQAFNRALAMAPAYLPALTNLERLDQIERKSVAIRPRYLAALAKEPANIALLEAMARLELADGKRALALSWIERASNVQPASLENGLRTAGLFLSADEPARAMTMAQALHINHPSEAAPLALLGQAAKAARRYKEAADAYAKLAALQPGHGGPLVQLAGAHIAQQHYPAAEQALARAITAEPALVDAHIELVTLHLKQRKPDAALAVAHALQQRYPDQAAGYKLAGDVHAAQGKHTEALAAYQKAFSTGPNGPALIQLSGALGKLGRAAEADTLIARWLREHPADVPTRMHVASSKLVGNDPAAAIPHLEAVLVREPRNVAALNDLAWSYQRVGNRKALELAERALAQAPDNPAVMDTLGWIHLERGDLKQARPLLLRASQLAPAAPEVQFHLGILLAKSGDKRGARRALEKAVASGPRFARAEEARALLATL